MNYCRHNAIAESPTRGGAMTAYRLRATVGYSEAVSKSCLAARQKSVNRRRFTSNVDTAGGRRGRRGLLRLSFVFVKRAEVNSPRRAVAAPTDR
ncbi:hypothetical protein EVAR_53148_1 [Eumeta japonica]|uniref:Uncharacterized protein n=1 Tax=Eumeta variegata TaxID=151549 RepID=A0A4C1YDC7_EUMVA|nr:hypothetical protein EVAR_53148_1 [Eumeta japonica]